MQFYQPPTEKQVVTPVFHSVDFSVGIWLAPQDAAVEACLQDMRTSLATWYNHVAEVRSNLRSLSAVPA